MALDRETNRALEKAYNAVRNAGGSIYGPGGQNYTADGWQGQFKAAMEASCWTDAASIQALAQAMENHVKRAKEIEEFNKIPTTKPKCHSKPLIHLLTGCRFEPTFGPRDGSEKSCDGGGSTWEEPET